MKLYVISDDGTIHEFKNIYIGGPDGTPIKLKKYSIAYIKAIIYAYMQKRIIVK